MDITLAGFVYRVQLGVVVSTAPLQTLTLGLLPLFSRNMLDDYASLERIDRIDAIDGRVLVTCCNSDRVTVTLSYGTQGNGDVVTPPTVTEWPMPLREPFRFV